MKITDEEYEIIIKTLAERFKNLIYMSAESRIRDVTDKKFIEMAIDTESKIEINYQFNIVFGDFKEILGGIRRLNINKKDNIKKI